MEKKEEENRRERENNSELKAIRSRLEEDIQKLK